MFGGGYYDAQVMRESNGNPFAKNTRSSATGLHQFTTGTWADMMRKHPDLALTLDGRTNADQSTRANKRFTEDNEGLLRNKGLDVNDQTRYAMHRFGAGDGPRLLQMDPNTPIDQAVSAQIMQANPDLRGKTIGDALRFNGSSPARSPGNFGPSTTIFPGNRPAPSPTPTEPEGFMAGGPGAWLGMPNGVTSGGYDVGQALQGAGAGLASISSPQQGAALAQLARGNEDKFSVHTNNATGSVLRINNKTGKVEVVSNGVPIKSDEQKAYDTHSGKQYSELNEKIAADGMRAHQQMAQFGQLKTALANPNVAQGAMGETILQAKKVGQMLGFNVEGIADSEMVQKVSNELALQLRNPTGGAGMPGALSDADRKFLTTMVPGLQNSPDGNQKVIDLYMKINQRAIDVDRLRSEYEEKHGRINAGFNRVVRQYANDNPLFGASTAAPAATTPPANRPPLSSIFK